MHLLLGAVALTVYFYLIYSTTEIHIINADESQYHIGQLIGYYHAVSDKNLSALDILLSFKPIASTMCLVLDFFCFGVIIDISYPNDDSQCTLVSLAT